MHEFDDLDEAFEKAPKPQFLPPGRYLVRAVSARHAKARSSPAQGISIQFVVVDGPKQGQLLRETLWFTGGASAISLETLDTIGLGGMKPSQILGLPALGVLPTVQVDARMGEYDGRPVVELVNFRRATPATREPGAEG